VELVRAVEDVLNADMRAVAKRLTQQAIWRVRCLNCGHPVAHHLDAAGEPTNDNIEMSAVYCPGLEV